MRKYLAATVLGAMLMAGQAAALDEGVVNPGDRIGATAAAADGMEGANGGALYYTLAVALVIGLTTWWATSQSPGVPASP